MKFKKRFKTMFVWRRQYRGLFRMWRENIKNKASHNAFSWRQNNHRAPHFYLANKHFLNKK